MTAYENSRCYSRAWFANRIEVARSSADVLARVTSDGFDGRRLAYIEIPGDDLRTADAGPESPTDAVTWAEWTPDRLSLKTTNS